MPNSCQKHNRPFVRGICGPCRIESRHKPAQAPPTAATVVQRLVDAPPTTKSGRPRKHKDNATKQAEYRRNKLLDATLEEKDTQVNSRGRLHGETLQPPEKVEQIKAAIDRDEAFGGRKK